METKFTKGNWIVKKGSEKKKWERKFYVYSEVIICEKCGKSDSRHICVSLESAVGLEQAEANAKLIATAPELFEMLKKILNIENHAFTLKGFDVKRLKSEISTILDKAIL